MKTEIIEHEVDVIEVQFTLTNGELVTKEYADWGFYSNNNSEKILHYSAKDDYINDSHHGRYVIELPNGCISLAHVISSRIVKEYKKKIKIRKTVIIKEIKIAFFTHKKYTYRIYEVLEGDTNE